MKYRDSNDPSFNVKVMKRINKSSGMKLSFLFFSFLSLFFLFSFLSLFFSFLFFYFSFILFAPPYI